MGGGSNDGLKHAVAGNVGGIVGLTISFPLDTIKTRMQTDGMYGREQRGMVGTARALVRQEGFRALYRGLLSPCLGYGFINAVAFGTNARLWDVVRSFDEPGTAADRQLNMLELYVCGLGAGFTQSFVRAPVERIKTVMQARDKAGKAQFRGSGHCALQLLKTEGIGSVFAGLNATIIRETPQYAMYYPTYEFLRRAWTPEGGSLHPALVAVAGGTAGTIQWLPPIYNIDVVKSRIQAADVGTYRGVWHCFRVTLEKEGAAVFFKGLTPALGRAFPLHAGVFLGYELTCRLWDDFAS